ncbi:hypothetical protein HYH02_014206 [Chlamydomonas schloesseri]|uniref:Uncharacterized protein n=1 Tax=Chlamydomonas schloesseri TaxID=2026947 RepID=A0A835SSJ9_9CHLO|nr:hypothetical protein HYH02_014206 [Chlamydomonas schloesseri]|eukprot:KAG2428883.1 hypothetical protein HYH02_014206 [Chlamydomonas schloesseri]
MADGAGSGVRGSVATPASRAEELAEELYREVVTPNTAHPAAAPRPPPLGELSFPVDPGRDWTPAQTPRTANTPAPGGLTFSRPGTATSHSHRSQPASALGSSGRASGPASPGRPGSQLPGSPLTSQRATSTLVNPQLVVSGGPATPPSTSGIGTPPSTPGIAAPPSTSGIGTPPSTPGTAAATSTPGAAAGPAAAAPAGPAAPTQPAPFEAARPHPHKTLNPPRVVAVDSGPYPYPQHPPYSPGSTGAGAVTGTSAGGALTGTTSASASASGAAGAAPVVPPLALPPNGLRGHNVLLPLPLSPHGTGNFSAGGGAGCSPSGRALGPLAIPSERNTLAPQAPAEAATASYGGYGTGGGGFGPPGPGPGPGAPSYCRGGRGGPAAADRVDAYLARYQLHAAIRAGFRTRGDDVQRSVEDLEARLATMRSCSQSPPREGQAATAEAEAAAAPAAAGSPPREGQSPQPSPPPNTAGGNGPRQPWPQSQPWSQSPPTLPEPPGGRNRFTLPPATGRPPSASLHRPSSASANGSPGRASPTQGDTWTSGAASGSAAAAAGATAAAGQGAYLALPDGSFAGTAPFKAAPTADGLLFERYNRHQRTTADLPEVQLRYLRPPGVTAPQQPRMLARAPRQGQPPRRTLPNGIPASRIERLSARRRSRSPPKLYQTQPLPPRQDTVMLTGVPAGADGDGGGMAADDLFRSTRPPGSPKGRGAAAAAAAAAANAGAAEGGGALAQYLAVRTAPATGEPLLDENFYAVLQQHFKSSVQQQTQQLRAHLNVSLPVVLGAMNCVNVTDPPFDAPPAAGGGTGSFAGATAARLQAQRQEAQQQAQVMTGSGRMLGGGGSAGGGRGGGGKEDGRRA